MITISVCMIVKNEEEQLRACLESLRPIADEIIIADTGSTDRTKEIAAEFTDKIYDFPWIDDFSAARNFVFSKASMDYIYTADADEVIDEKNIELFKKVKMALLPEIEIVQMYYLNLMETNTAYNSKREMRPKLFKRLRTFEWINPVHETVRLDPVIYDSGIEIQHLAKGSHAKRDFRTFQKALSKGMRLDKVLHGMYAKELFIAGDNEDLAEAEEFYKAIVGEKRVFYLKTGVDTQKFVPVSKEKKDELKEKYGLDSRPVILHVGHLNRGRNVAQLMKLDKKYQILLVLSTLTKNERDTELENELRKNPNIRIIDEYIPDIEEIYQLSDAYFFPVVEQGKCIDVPLSAMEAASCNKPVITTGYGEMKQFRGMEGFYFIESFDEKDLNALIEKALSREDAHSRSSVLDYDWDNAVMRLTEE